MRLVWPPRWRLLYDAGKTEAVWAAVPKDTAPDAAVHAKAAQVAVHMAAAAKVKAEVVAAPARTAVAVKVKAEAASAPARMAASKSCSGGSSGGRRVTFRPGNGHKRLLLF
ncbi:MAG TPA: hypothetical protein VHT96_00825 [Clostridia bacterium]|nr:hypothetical protein [Clostridia bacterium]